MTRPGPQSGRYAVDAHEADRTGYSADPVPISERRGRTLAERAGNIPAPYPVVRRHDNAGIDR